MTREQAHDLERYWGAPGPPPDSSWRCCMWCGDYWPPEAVHWSSTHKRLCRACKQGSEGLCRECCEARVPRRFPRSRQWLRKNRWSIDGHIVRRCNICTRWKRLTEYYLVERRDAKNRAHWWYPWAMCTPCAIARKGYRSATEMRREMRNQRRLEKAA